MQADGQSPGYQLGVLLAHNPEISPPHLSTHNCSQVFRNCHLEPVARAMPQQILACVHCSLARSKHLPQFSTPLGRTNDELREE